MYHMSAHWLPQYYQPQWVPCMAWTDLVIVYALHTKQIFFD